MYIPYLYVKEHVVMRKFFVLSSLVFGCLSRKDHYLFACVFRVVVWYVLECKKVAQDEKQ